MKKKYFIPLSFSYILLILFILSMGILILVAYIALLSGNIDDPNILYYIFIPFAILFLFYTVIRLILCLKIVISTTYIKTSGDWMPKFEKIQYKTLINLKDIKNIEIIASEKDSRNKRIQLNWLSSYMPKKYFEFTLTNGSKKRLCINYYYKKQVIRMLNYVIKNMKNSGNDATILVDDVMKNWYSYGGYSKFNKK